MCKVWGNKSTMRWVLKICKIVMPTSWSWQLFFTSNTTWITVEVSTSLNGYSFLKISWTRIHLNTNKFSKIPSFWKLNSEIDYFYWFDLKIHQNRIIFTNIEKKWKSPKITTATERQLILTTFQNNMKSSVRLGKGPLDRSSKYSTQIPPRSRLWKKSKGKIIQVWDRQKYLPQWLKVTGLLNSERL